MKKVSIIIPVYNTERYLERCLTSLFEQTYQNLQIIVVDDGSTGNVKDIVDSYQKSGKKIELIVHECNKGLFRARISGALRANGDYIAFLDSDDYVGIDYYRLLVNAAAKDNLDVVMGETVLVEDTMQVMEFHGLAVPNEILVGEEIRDKWLELEGKCYRWHTIWNKLYKKSLWDKCMHYYQKVVEHIVMTEDIAFSFPLLYFSKRFKKINNCVYYYCQNKDSSTDSNKMNYQKYEKNIHDIFYVFKFVQDFLESVGASEKEKEKFDCFRDYYKRLWKNGIKSILLDEDKKKAEKCFEDFFGHYEEKLSTDDVFFDSIKAEWNDSIEEIKKEIRKEEYLYISFDIFDTAVVRPFYCPEDLFFLLDKTFEENYTCGMSFHSIRIDGERIAREQMHLKHKDQEDVTIDDIYASIEKEFFIPIEICNILKHKEKKLEIQFTNVREVVKELYEYAGYLGKKRIFISDMYLDYKTVTEILEKNGYFGYERVFLSSEEGVLKNTGALYECVLNKLGISSKQIIHMGDTFNNDIIMAERKGIHAVYIPKTIDVFKNKVNNLSTGFACNAYEQLTNGFIDKEKVEESIGYGSMLSMIANKYFDNPFRTFVKGSDYNVDPKFVGYYVVGMHLLGLVKWISLNTKNYNRILFMSRDGFLIKQAYDIWRDITKKGISSAYIYVSRKLLMPFYVNCKTDLMNLPIEFHAYAPKDILDLLQCCHTKLTKDLMDDISLNYNYNKLFETKNEYQSFMRYYSDNIYDEEENKRNKNLIKEYFSWIDKKDIAFDMGYSGSIQYAFNLATMKNNDVLFVHSDAIKSFQMSRKGKFNIKNFFDFSPSITGLLREHILSDYHPACTAVNKARDGRLYLTFGKENKVITDLIILKSIHQSALEFVLDYLKMFSEYLDYVSFKSFEVSLPFEAFLRNINELDLKMFSGAYFEDRVYGGNGYINVAEFMKNKFYLLGDYNRNHEEGGKIKVILNSVMKKTIVIFGTGRICRRILEQYPGIQVEYFIDNDLEKDGRRLNGVEIKHFSRISDTNKVFIVIAIKDNKKVIEQLENIGLKQYYDYACYQDIFTLTTNN